MKKILEIIGIVLGTFITYFIVLLFLTATVGHQEFKEWTVYSLSNNYYVENYNLYNVRLIKKEKKRIKRVNINYVLEVSSIKFLEDERELYSIKLLKNDAIKEMSGSDLEIYIKGKKYTDKELEYIIIEPLKDRIYGPYSVQEYNHIININYAREYTCRSTYGGGGFC